MSSANILVVEDEFIVAKDIQNRLKKFGYSVPAIAASAAEAMKKVIDHTPDLVLMDICLKGSVDGVEAAQEIYTTFNIPIVYLTANADDSTLERAKLTEPFGYILKPFKEKELKTTIEIALTKHRTEIKLKESEQWLNTVLKSIGDAVIACDSSGKVTFMNPVAEGLTGWKQTEAFGKQTTEVFNIINEEVTTLAENPITHALEKGIIASIPERTKLIAKNGVEIPIDDSAAPLKDERGNITGAVLVFRDISERQQIEAARQKQIEQERLVAQLEKLNEIKDDFLSTVSHELRTPIANMKMAIQMLKVSGGGANERSQRYLDILQTECTRESDLINDLLDLQRLEAAAYPTFIGEAIDLQQWLPSTLEPFKVRTQERQQILKLDSDHISPLISDRASLDRILAELLNNACKYTPANGEIILSVRKQQNNLELYPSSIQSENSLTLDSFEETRYCVAPTPATIFTISNQAEISADQLPRIFDKFYRIPKGDRWKQGGTGLGLALVQKLTEHLQGTISVTSNEGWTTFTVKIPDLVPAF